jgi:CRISPR-associated protein Csb2
LDQKPSQVWKTLTPYVPPRHVYDRKGRVKDGCSIQDQIARELADLGKPRVTAIEVKDAGWVKVHQKISQGSGQTNSDKRGYHITLTLEEPISDVLSLGSSSHFGLGLFVPV